MRNRRFGQNVQLFGANYHFSTFRSTFQQKVAKSASFREKASKIVDLAKILNLFEQTTTFRRLGELFSKKVQNVPHFRKKHENLSFWPKGATFLSKARCLAVWVNFSAKSCKKCPISPQSMRNRRFGQNFQLFQGNHHVLAFGSTFKQEVATSASFFEKPWKIVDLAKM